MDVGASKRPSSKSKEKWARWEERWSAACRAPVTHSRVAHIADLYLQIERDVKVIALCYGRPPTYGLYAITIVMSPRQELPGDDRGTNPPAVAGRLFCFTIRPGRLSLPSVAYEFTSIPGRVQFAFDFSLVAVTRIRASVSTPPKLT
ncbi:hypothetical protein V6N13_063967 [Hibiscus sabdariffa]|uniref:Uncharacterized protein n=2 Tax=Hibiscus sabdariffa TaxID=183260 RepID=A0ABR2BBY3_9ROSI